MDIITCCNHEEDKEGTNLIEYCSSCMKIMCTKCNPEPHKDHGLICYDCDEVKVIANRSREIFDKLKNKYKDLESQYKEHRKSLTESLKSIEEDLNKDALKDMKKWNDWGNLLSNFLVYLDNKQRPVAIPSIDIEKIVEESSKLEDRIEILKMKRNGLESLIKGNSKDANLVDDTVKKLKEQINKYLGDICLKKYESLSLPVEKVCQNKLAFIISLHAIYQDKLKEVEKQLKEIRGEQFLREPIKSQKVKVNEIEIATTELIAMNNKIKNFKAKSDELKEQIDKQVNSLKENERLSNIRSEEIKDKEIVLMKLQKDIKEAEAKKEEMNKSSKDLKEIENKVAELEEKRRTLKEEMEDLSNKLQADKKEKEELKGIISKYKDKCKRRQIEDGENELQSNNKQNKLDEIIKKKNEEKNALEKDIMNLEKNVSRLQEKTEKVRAIDKKLATLRREYESIVELIEALQEKAKEKSSNAELTIKDYDSKLSGIGKIINEKNKLLEEDKESRDKLESSVQELRKEKKSLNKECKEKQRMLNPKIIIKCSLSEEAKINVGAKATASNSKERDNLTKELVNLSSTMTNAFGMKAINFVNMFPDVETVKSTLKLIVSNNSYESIIVENGGDVFGNEILNDINKLSNKRNNEIILYIKVPNLKEDRLKELNNLKTKFFKVIASSG